MNNPSCINLIFTNSPNSFQNTSTFCARLTDFHKFTDFRIHITFSKAPAKMDSLFIFAHAKYTYLERRTNFLSKRFSKK